jgi:sulfur carrier protein
MTVTVNGDSLDIADGSSVADVLELLGLPRKGVAVALDGAVVPRATWAVTPIVDGATVEVLTAVQGG